MGAKKLTTQQRDWLLNAALSSTSVEEMYGLADFSNRLEFYRWLRTNPEFYAELKQHWVDSCEFVECDMLNIHKLKNMDHKLARIRLEAMVKVLAFRNPAKYSQRIDVNMNQSVSVRIALDGANERVQQLLGIKDITPALNAGAG